MTEEKIDLSIIIPAYMEAAHISDTLEKLASFLNSRDYGQTEVLVVVADSPDGTAKIAESKASLFKRFRLIKAGPRAGKGRDVRLGIYEAKGHYKLFMDADLATPLKHLDDVKHLVIDQNSEIGIAVRDLWTIHKSTLRKVISKSSNIAAQVLLTPGIKDTQCGFKVFRADVAEAVFSRMTMLSWSFDAEILLIARQLHYKPVTIEAPEWKDPKAAGLGLTGDHPVKAALKGFADLWTIRWNAIIGRYNHPNYVHKPMY